VYNNINKCKLLINVMSSWNINNNQLILEGLIRAMPRIIYINVIYINVNQFEYQTWQECTLFINLIYLYIDIRFINIYFIYL